MANKDRFSVRDKSGAIVSIEERTRRTIVAVDRLLVEFVDVVRLDGYGYSRLRFMKERSPTLLGWDQRTSSAVLSLRSRRPAAAGQPAKRTTTYVLVKRDGKRGVVMAVDAKVVQEAVRRSPHEPAAAVRAAERWLWPVSPKQFSQADRRLELLIVPEPEVPVRAAFFQDAERRIGTRHELKAPEIAEYDGITYALCPTLRAVHGDYPAFSGEYQWYSFWLPRSASAVSDTSASN